MHSVRTCLNSFKLVFFIMAYNIITHDESYDYCLSIIMCGVIVYSYFSTGNSHCTCEMVACLHRLIILCVCFYM